jgi:hypothetical protein
MSKLVQAVSVGDDQIQPHPIPWSQVSAVPVLGVRDRLPAARDGGV